MQNGSRGNNGACAVELVVRGRDFVKDFVRKKVDVMEIHLKLVLVHCLALWPNVQVLPLKIFNKLP